MIRNTSLILFLLLHNLIQAQEPDWHWVNTAGGVEWDIATDVAIDNDGNNYVVGYFQNSSLAFGPYTITNHGLGISQDLFVVKYDKSGQVLWAQGAGGPANDAAWSVAVDGTGNCYVTGYFQSDFAVFGTDTVHKDTVNNTSDIFLVKYSPQGNVLWALS